MKKRVIFALLAMLLATPIAYASYVYFYPPEPVLNVTSYPALNSVKTYREAYKPYPVPRSEAAINHYYNVETKRYMQSVGKEFKDSARKVDESVKTVDNAARDFDTLATTVY